MPEHLYLCGLDEAQRIPFADGQILSLDKVSGNLILKLDQMRKTLAGTEPERLTDFLEIASYVFAADRTTGRGTAILKNMGEAWRRTFRLVIGVRDVSFWNRNDVNEALSEALAFLSEDMWRFEFSESRNPRPLQEYFNLQMQEPNSGGAVSIVLFSGGLDSLAGAVHELQTSNKHVVLVSHRNLPFTGARQKELAERLADDFPTRVTHVFIDNSLSSKLPDREVTQRTRSFFFTAIAAVAAHIEKSDRICFYENGVMSVNLPIATQVVGSRASRSTHPRSLQLLQQLVGLVSMHFITVGNPFIWKTKAEIIRELAASKQGKLITRSLSCSRSRTGNKTFAPHCGTCIQCLHRRISTLGGGAADLDEKDGYETDFLTGTREKTSDRVMAFYTARLALDCAALSDRDFLSRFADEFGMVMQAYPLTEQEAVAKMLIEIFRRYGQNVFEIISDAVRKHSEGITGSTLPPSSLLAMLVASNVGDRPKPSQEALIKLPAPQPEVPSATSDERKSKVLVAIDDTKKMVLVWGGPTLNGDAIFPIVKLLVELRMEDRKKRFAPKNFRSLLAKQIADELGISNDEAVRSAVKRARDEYAEVFCSIEGFYPRADAWIQNVIKKGYRLNPDVEVISMDEFSKL